jgi:hypothetical protein
MPASPSYADLTQENRERRRAEKALRASEERLPDIGDNPSARYAARSCGYFFSRYNGTI